jgi:hypothetical protein
MAKVMKTQSLEGEEVNNNNKKRELLVEEYSSLVQSTLATAMRVTLKVNSD